LVALLRRHPTVFVGYLLYFWTAAPGIGACDTALLVEEMRTLALSTHANHHNLTIGLGWLVSFVPLGSAVRQATLLQAFLGGTAVLLFYVLVFRTFGRRRVAVLATLAVTVLHSLWWHSTIAEVYAANAVLTMLALIVLVRLREEPHGPALPVLFFLAGLSLFNHVAMGFVAAGAAACLVLRLVADVRAGEARGALRAAIRCTAAFGAGFLPYAVVFVLDARRLGGFRPALAQALGGDFQSIMFKGGLLEAATDLGFLLVWQIPSPFLLAVVLGVPRLVRSFAGSPSLAALGVMFALNTGFFAFYPTWDKFAFLLPSFIMLAFAGAHALDWLDRRLGSLPYPGVAAAAVALSFVVPPPFLYSQLPSLSRFGGRLARFGNERTKNLFDEGLYVANPDKRRFSEYQAGAAALLARLPTGAVYVDDDSRTYYVIRHLQKYEGARTDFRLELVNNWGFSNWGLSRDGFVDLVRAARERSIPLFLSSLEEPYLPHLMAVPEIDGYRFRRFFLDEHRWVYRLVPRTEEPGLPPEAPLVATLVVGEGLGSKQARVRTGFLPHEPITAELRFERNGEPFALLFRWRGPGGGEEAGRPLRVPFGCVRVWTTLEAPRPLAEGTWAVTAESSGTPLASASFRVGEAHAAPSGLP
jgi:hypothetical protein